jgi:16S rRNA (cytosine967-C5)-methyltransferase
VRRGKITNVDGRRLRSELGNFDRILLDAPCTGLGALRRRPEIRWRRSISDLGPLQQLQRELLASAADALNPGGLIGYATCSPHLIETKLQIRRFLAENPHFTRVSVTDKYADSDGDLQLWTHRDGTDCMFLSLLRKTA